MRDKTRAKVMANRDAASEVPRHLYRLPGTDWAIWRSVCLRAPGFPVSDVLPLASSGGAEAADALIAALDEMEAARQVALTCLRSAWQRQTDQAQRRQLRDAIRQLWKGRRPNLARHPCDAAAEIAELNRAVEQVAHLRRRFDDAYAQAVQDASHHLQQVVGDNRFREAVTWQNLGAVRTGLDALRREAAQQATRRSQQRKHEALVASYLQRYCTKNDTIGFFGPVGWAKVVDANPGLRVIPGARLLASRDVYFEVWGIDALAEVIAQDERIKKWLAPRRRHDVSLQGRALHLPSGQIVALSRVQAQLLDACDGDKSAVQIAAERDESEAMVYRMLAELEQQAWITWQLEVPLQLRPEKALRRLLMAIEEEGLRDGALAKLDQLEAARCAVASAENAVTLAEAMQAAEVTFKAITGRRATRSDGETYAARTLIYEDCRRDLNMEIGPDLMAALGGPLSLLLQSARWFTYEVAQLLRCRLDQVYRDMTRQSGQRGVALTRFWAQVQEILNSGENNPLHQVSQGFQQRWEAILAVDATQARAGYACEALEAAVQAAFEAPGPGWRYARHHSPDVMIAAKDVEAIRRGAYDLVLGEFHMGVNTLNCALFLAQNPSPAALLANIEADFPQPRLLPMVPKREAAGTSGRFLRVLVSPKDYHLQWATGPSTVPRSQVIPVGDLIVVDHAGQLQLQTRDGRFEMELVEGIADWVATGVINRFKMLADRPHTPRVQIGKLVVQRECWVVDAHELTFAHEREGGQRYLRTRQWQRQKGVPRHVFVRTAAETKPVYVDFDSPVYVDMLSKLIRAASEQKRGNGGEVIISEMLPGPDAAWLPDQDGQHYTSELRMIAVDLKSG